MPKKLEFTISNFVEQLNEIQEQDLEKVASTIDDVRCVVNALPKFSKLEFSILFLLLKNGPMHGRDFLVHSGLLIPRGSIYTTLNRMVGKGYIEKCEIKSEGEGQEDPYGIVYKIVDKYITVLKIQLLLGWFLLK